MAVLYSLRSGRVRSPNRYYRSRTPNDSDAVIVLPSIHATGTYLARPTPNYSARRIRPTLTEQRPQAARTHLSVIVAEPSLQIWNLQRRRYCSSKQPTHPHDRAHAYLARPPHPKLLSPTTVYDMRKPRHHRPHEHSWLGGVFGREINASRLGHLAVLYEHVPLRMAAAVFCLLSRTSNDFNAVIILPSDSMIHTTRHAHRPLITRPEVLSMIRPSPEYTPNP